MFAFGVVTDDQLSLPFPTPDVQTAEAPCPTCRGAGEVYYLAGRPDVIGGKRVVCPTCAGEGTVRVPVGTHRTPGASPTP